MVYGYPSEFSQVIFNIISNAKDVLIQREIQEPEIIINIDQNEKHIYCEIMDNGGGIDEKYLDKIFEPYFTTKDVNGTGIGLYISKEIIHKHMKGTLHAENSVKGAKFTISIPKHKDV